MKNRQVGGQEMWRGNPEDELDVWRLALSQGEVELVREALEIMMHVYTRHEHRSSRIVGVLAKLPPSPRASCRRQDDPKAARLMKRRHGGEAMPVLTEIWDEQATHRTPVPSIVRGRARERGEGIGQSSFGDGLASARSPAPASVPLRMSRPYAMGCPCLRLLRLFRLLQ